MNTLEKYSRRNKIRMISGICVCFWCGLLYLWHFFVIDWLGADRAATGENVLAVLSSISSVWVIVYELMAFIPIIKSEIRYNITNLVYVMWQLLVVFVLFLAIETVPIHISLIIVFTMAVLIEFIRPYVLLRRAGYTPLGSMLELIKAALFCISFLIGSFHIYVWLLLPAVMDDGKYTDEYGDVHYHHAGGYYGYAWTVFILSLPLWFGCIWYGLMLYHNHITKMIEIKSAT